MTQTRSSKKSLFPIQRPLPESNQKPQATWARNQVVELITKGFSKVSEMFRLIHWDWFSCW